MLNLQLQIPGSNIGQYSIRFPQSKQISELIEWIYDNFNKFFKLQNKNKINIYNYGNGQNYRYSNQLLSSCLKNNDILKLGEVQSEKELHFYLEYQSFITEIIIEDDITIQELMEFAYCTFDISNDIKLDFIYENFNLSNQNIKKKLAEFNIQNNGKIKIVPHKIIDNNLINIQILFRDTGSSIKQQFFKSDILAKIIQAAIQYLGLNQNMAALSVIYKGRYYNNDKTTLSEMKLVEDDIIEIKISYCGGQSYFEIKD
ncbi:unnamed protein product [Paramecium pentaurelia]|uniref:Ubiquitin-like domain-containing protein n=1 Tax=Paramecium pentaurelia TaxID=43138 RepID=A0A8S1T583_9CILI|nr:unnamed protein product [Paramecium pentaurelia]